MIKRILTIFTVILSFSFSVYAAEGVYDPALNVIKVTGEQYGYQTVVVLKGTSSLDTLSSEKPFYAGGFLADGAYTYTIPVGYPILSDNYYVYVGTESVPTEVFVVKMDVADTFVSTVLDVQNSTEAFKRQLLSDECKNAIGVDSAKISSYAEPLAKMLYSKKPYGDYTTFDGYFKTFELYAKINTYTDTESLLKSNREALNIDMTKDYDTLNNNGKAKMLELLKNNDYAVNSNFSTVYRQAYLQAAFYAAEYYTDLQSLVEQHYSEYGINITELNSCSDKAAVYTTLMTTKDNILVFTDIASAVSEAIAQANKSLPGNGIVIGGLTGTTTGGISIGGGGGGGVVMTPADNINITDVAEEQSRNINNKPVFSDIADYAWAEEAIEYLKNKNVINGVSETIFAPGNTITRAEFSKIAAALLKLDGGECIFDDVDKSDWFYPYVAACTAIGLVNGTGNSFEPYSSITREDAAVIIHRIALSKNAELDGTLTFKDGKLISDYAAQAVGQLAKKGIVKGDNNEMFNPKANLTRAEAAVLFYRAVTVFGVN